ncbi:MAG: tetratricopeptide repeat protein [Betaproteobacteria bacterium]
MTAHLSEARTLLQSGQTNLAAQRLAHITAAEPRNAEAFALLATAFVRMQRLPDAQRSIRCAIALNRESADFLLTAANIEQDLGNPQSAVELLRQALRLQPAFAQAHNNLGIVLSEQGKIQEAIEAFVEAIRLHPGYARAHANLSATRMRTLQLPEALQSARRAVELQPDYAHAHHLQANAYSMLGNLDAAETASRNALRLNAALVESSLLLAQVLAKLKRADEAEQVVRHALTLSPKRPELWSLLGDILSGHDDMQGTLEAYQRSLALRPNDLTTNARAALLLPYVYASEAHLAACRDRFVHGMEYLNANAEVLTRSVTRDRFGDAVPNNFLLAYQGGNDTELQRLYGDFVHRLVLQAMPEQENALAVLRTRLGQTIGRRRIRVGFCSRFFFRSTVGNYFASWITDIDRSQFEVFVYHPHVVEDEVVARIRSAADHFIQGAENFAFFSQRIAADELDILIYPELGMDLTCFMLAALRLAPVQVCAWGHPVTSGHPGIDFYISCAAMEPANANEHYCERLLMLPGIGTRYELPTLSPEAAAKTRVDYQLPQDAHLYLCPQSLFKVHPANDRLLVAAMVNDPKGVLVMFAGQNDGVTQKFVARLSAAFAASGLAPQGRVKLLPFTAHDDYKRINALCDVMLDTLHWSGGNTSLDALAMGLPVVTLPGEFMRGRQTMGMLRLLGVEELIATSADDYLVICARVANDAQYRQHLSQRILANSARLFDDPAPTAALGELFKVMLHEVGGAIAQAPPPLS